ncbi:MAG: aminopeptidase [Bacteroidaceae bacterium]|nr:aminopeptidase [Bacteroidaceae bacterium]
MKKAFIITALFALGTSLFAQENKEEGFQFTVVKENPITSTKNQNNSGTCWAFSSLGFFEAELLRMGKGEWDFSEMYLAHKTYEDRAKASVRLHGDISFSQGGSFYDAVYCMKHYGMIPQSAMPEPGTLYGDTLPNFSEFFSILEPQVAAIAKGKQKKLSPIWFKSINSTLDNYLGECPAEFTYEGKTYTPQSYMASTGLNMDDYVSLTSFTHHPFYEEFVIEVQDNWRWGLSYNLPLDEFMEVMESGVKNGYTFAWGADVTENGFSRDGIAVCPDLKKVKDENGSDYARWFGTSGTSNKTAYTARPLPEITVTQEMRQEAYDNWETTDDHGMLIYGIAKDQNGKEYFMVKNSWGTNYKYNGVWYASKAFVAYKTMNILIHKDAIPKNIAKKLGLK